MPYHFQIDQDADAINNCEGFLCGSDGALFGFEFCDQDQADCDAIMEGLLARLNRPEQTPLDSAAPDFLAACEGPGEDVTPLEWLSALLSDVRESNWADGREDPQAAWEAVYRAETLLENLAKATRKAKGE